MDSTSSWSDSAGGFASSALKTPRIQGSHPDRVIVFARVPTPGQAKTRLIPALGQEGAAQLQEALTRRALEVVHRHRSSHRCDVEVRYCGGEASHMRALFGSAPRYSAQEGDSLGERLDHAVSTAFNEGAKQVVVIGSDCPELEPTTLADAFRALSHADVVLGPAVDGGYYLIGLRTHRPELFCHIDWSTEQVFRQTLDKARRTRCKVAILKPLADVDYPEDLLACRRVHQPFSDVLPTMQVGLLSVVIPTLNEAGTIEPTLRSLKGQKDIEAIVADGGSTDATVEIARCMETSVVSARPGRGRQMNAGAAVARGEALLFLHADTELPEGFQQQVWAALERGAIAGAFRLKIAADNRSLRWIEWGANLRSRRFEMPYGDQGLFVQSDQFYRIGGFPDWPLMEDYELCRRLRKLGRISIASSAVRTSARRWSKLGPWRTTLVNQLCVLGFHLGVPPKRLARLYRRNL